MKRNFKKALKEVLIHEGGYVDHPKDPGGATNRGVTLTTYRRFFGADKSKEDLKKITDKELEQIYRTGFWDKSCCDDLPPGVDYAVFDAAVNSGPGRGAKWLQQAIGAKQDGGIGPKTLAKVGGFDPAQLVDQMCDCRLGFLRGLGTWSTFGKGWERRVEGVRAKAESMAGGTPQAITETAPVIEFRTTKRGSKGEWVRKLQQGLGLQVDGIFGKDTEASLKAWQEENGLEADGIAGRATYRALGLLA